jgi:hemerythrin-like metal-binding protein
MMQIEWRDSFRTGIPGVDHEHRELVEKLNSAIRAMDDGAERDHIIGELEEIYADIASHFALEEELMRRHRYHQYAGHAADHHRLLDEIREITQRFENTESPDADRFAERLSAWFQGHFSTFDAGLHREAFMEETATGDPASAGHFLRNVINALLGRKR